MPVHTATRRQPSKRRPPQSPPAPQAPELTALTEEWWSSWRRANQLGWDYLNAVSGLMRLNMNVLARPSLFVATLPALPTLPLSSLSPFPSPSH
jgi:hypothetical protein